MDQAEVLPTSDGKFKVLDANGLGEEQELLFIRSPIYVERTQFHSSHEMKVGVSELLLRISDYTQILYSAIQTHGKVEPLLFIDFAKLNERSKSCPGFFSRGEFDLPDFPGGVEWCRSHPGPFMSSFLIFNDTR